MDGTSILTTTRYTITENISLVPLQDNSSVIQDMKPADHSYDDLPILTLGQYNSDIVQYIAGYISRSISNKIDCHKCQSSLVEEINCDKYNSILINRKNRGGLVYPSKDVINICTYIERLIQCVIISQKLSKYNITKIKIQALDASSDALLYLVYHSYISDEPGMNHRLILIKNIIDLFIKIRMHQVAKERNQIKVKRIRTKFTKLILFNNE